MKNGKITGKLRWQPDKFRAETTHQLYLLCLLLVNARPQDCKLFKVYPESTERLKMTIKKRSLFRTSARRRK